MNLKLSPLFSDGMVLQRGEKINIFGTAVPKDKIIVGFLGEQFSTVCDADGNWICETGIFTEGGPYEMTVKSANDEIMIRNILIGDVWVCGGQSNMELMMNRTKNMYPDEMLAGYSEIRQFKVPQVYSFKEPKEDYSEGFWEEYTPETAEGFTAVGYFFAKKLYEKNNVPIGLLASAVGGTPIHAWMSAGMLKDFPEALAEAEKYKDDGYIESLANEYAEHSAQYFKALGERDDGLKQDWSSPEYDDTKWEELPLTFPVGESGVYWFRKTIELPESVWGKEAAFFFGTAADSFDVYINGEIKGRTYYRYPPCEFGFTLPNGSMTIAIRLVALGGDGGFISGKNRFIACGNNSIRLDGSWKRRKGADGEAFKGEVFVKYMPTGLFGGMVFPLSRLAIKGVIWYQGESDGGNPERYGEKFFKLIKGWRELWNIGDFPFLFVELAHWGEGDPGWEKLREKQRDCLILPNTGMAAAYDLGEANDLHPQNKRDVGERLARLALRIAYGEELPHTPFEMCGFISDN